MNMNQNLGNLMKEAQKMQQRMQEAQQQLTELVVTGEAGSGMVTIKMNGRHDVIEVKIKRSLMDDDVEMLEDLVAASINDAVRKIEKVSKEKISQLTAGLNIPSDLMGEGDKGIGLSMDTLKRLVDALRCLPGVGPKSAQRMVFHLLQHQRQRGLHLAACLEQAMNTIRPLPTMQRLLGGCLVSTVLQSPTRPFLTVCSIQSSRRSRH